MSIQLSLENAIHRLGEPWLGVGLRLPPLTPDRPSPTPKLSLSRSAGDKEF